VRSAVDGTRALSIADFGLMGPMFRRFGQDPTPAAINVLPPSLREGRI
jgi:hypothetical protein